MKSLAPVKREHTTILELKKNPVLGVGSDHKRVSALEVTVYARSVPLVSPEYSNAGLEPTARVAMEEAPVVVNRSFPIELADNLTRKILPVEQPANT